MGDVDWSFKSDCAHSGAILEVPEDAFPVLGGGEEVATVAGPAGVGLAFVSHGGWSQFTWGDVPERLDLSRVTLQFARHSVRFNIENHHRAVHLRVS